MGTLLTHISLQCPSAAEASQGFLCLEGNPVSLGSLGTLDEGRLSSGAHSLHSWARSRRLALSVPRVTAL